MKQNTIMEQTNDPLKKRIKVKHTMVGKKQPTFSMD